MKERYTKPVVEKEDFKTADVITTSAVESTTKPGVDIIEDGEDD